MKKIIKRFKSWKLLTKFSVIGSVFSIVGTLFTIFGLPLVVIGYFQFFGNDVITKNLTEALKVNVRPHLIFEGIEVKSDSYDGDIIEIDIENISSFWACNVVTSIKLSDEEEIEGKFSAPVYQNINRGIPPRSKVNLSIAPLKPFLEALEKEYPDKKVIDFYIGKESKPKTSEWTEHRIFSIVLEYETEAGEGRIQTQKAHVVLE